MIKRNIFKSKKIKADPQEAPKDLLEIKGYWVVTYYYQVKPFCMDTKQIVVYANDVQDAVERAYIDYDIQGVVNAVNRLVVEVDGKSALTRFIEKEESAHNAGKNKSS